MRNLAFVNESTQEESSFLLPCKWDELTPKQLLFLIGLVNNNISAEEIKLKMLFRFCVATLEVTITRSIVGKQKISLG